MTGRLKKTVVLVGMMGAGKTAVGRSLAERLDVPFKDSDAEIVLASNMSIAEIFERDGEEFFRAKETQVIERLIKNAPCILSTGGGAFLRAQNRDLISANAVSVWLNADLELLWERVRGKDTRPLLQTADPYATLSDLFNQRSPIYETADLNVKAKPDIEIEDMAQLVELALKKRPDVLEVQDG